MLKYVEKRRITKTSNYLLVQLQRFEQDLYGNVSKTTTNVEPDIEVTVNSEIFEIVGLVYHSGSSGAGHYVCVFRSGDSWILYNDAEAPKFFSEKRQKASIYLTLKKKSPNLDFPLLEQNLENK